MADAGSNAQEIFRLRDRQGKQERELAGFDYRLRDLARGLGELRDQVHELREQVDGMTEAEKIATAVAAAMRQDRRRWFNGYRRAGAAAAAVVVLIPAVHDAVSWLYG